MWVDTLQGTSQNIPANGYFTTQKWCLGGDMLGFFHPKKWNREKLLKGALIANGWVLMIQALEPGVLIYIYIYTHRATTHFWKKSGYVLELYQLIGFSLLHIFRDFLTKTYPVPASHPSRNSSVPHMVLRTSPYKLQRSPAAKAKSHWGVVFCFTPNSTH